MINTKILPAHILRLYCLELLKKHAGLEKIGQYEPIIPFNDVPQVADSGKPYLIYGFAENGGNGIEQEGVFSLRIIAPTFAKMGEITNVLSLGFDNSDIATEAVNRYSSKNDALVGIRFTTISKGYTEGGEPPDDEGGPVEGIVSISYRYVNSLGTPIVKSANEKGLWI